MDVVESFRSSRERASNRGGRAEGPAPIIVRLRNDLRVGDNPALAAAAKSGRPILAVYLLDEPGAPARPLGGAARWWLHHSLAAFDAALRSRARPGHPAPQLVLRRGDPLAVLRDLCAATQASRVVWNRVHEPGTARLDERIASALAAAGTEVEDYPGALLVEPSALRTASGTPYRVFSAFWNRLSALDVARPVAAPRTLLGLSQRVPSDRLADWGLRPRAGWDAGLARTWTAGEREGAARLRAFLARGLASYRDARDFPHLRGTSRLSPHLSRGELSARQVWHAVLRDERGGRTELSASGFLRELAWGEFARHVLAAHPDLAERPLRAEFEAFRWRTDASALARWQSGLTGYPIVDAGMRELWHTGWMHNRVRMIAASFLVKDLLLPWQAGESWFWDTLVDADPASNAVNWQWVAGCGIDAAPYFRIFNPVAQSRRFDPQGRYLRAWLPALRALPEPFIHEPWSAPKAVLARAGVRLGESYPEPIVDHEAARRRALERFAQCRKRKARR